MSLFLQVWNKPFCSFGTNCLY